jgi:hypothetical protein
VATGGIRSLGILGEKEDELTEDWCNHAETNCCQLQSARVSSNYRSLSQQPTKLMQKALSSGKKGLEGPNYILRYIPHFLPETLLFLSICDSTN